MPKVPTYDDSPEGEDGDEHGHVATLPKSILMGKTFNVGDEVVLKITAIRGGEVEVEYASEPGDETEPEPAPDEGEGQGEADVPAEGEGEPQPAEPATAGPPAYE